MAKIKLKVLVDTNVFLWSLGGHTASPKLKEFFEDRVEREFFVSHITGWEIAIKYGLRKLTLPEAPESFFPDRLRRSDFFGLPIELDHVLQVHRLPPIHRDPFDRLLIAQAMPEGLSILTSDSEIPKYDVKTIPFTRFTNDK